MPANDAARGLRLRQFYILFAPLAFSGAFFPVARPVINAALARTDDPEMALAAYSVALSVSLPLVAPLFGMRQIVTALCVDRDMIRRLGRLVWCLGGAATVIVLLLAIPSVYILVTDQLLGIPQEIADLGPPAMLLLATSPLLLIGRGYYQGILVHYGEANPIGVGALGYLVGCSVVVFGAVLWLDLPGAVAAALALMAGNVIYLLIVWPPTRSLYRTHPPKIVQRAEGFDPQKRSMRYILSLYHPLALSTMLTAGVEPVVQMAMAHTPQVTQSLAAYAVCVSIVWLARTNLWNTQQVVIAKVKGSTSYAAAKRFVMSLGLGTTAIMSIGLLPAVGDAVFGDLIGLQGVVKEYARHGYAMLLIVPYLQGWRSLSYGTLVALGDTGGIRTAAILRIVVLVLALGTGVLHGGWPGIYVAAGATLLAEFTEVAALQISVRGLLARAPADR
jgi:progressive ankylosis protein